jgi:outer membrane lipoprotein-sorting protein
MTASTRFRPDFFHSAGITLLLSFPAPAQSGVASQPFHNPAPSIRQHSGRDVAALLRSVLQAEERVPFVGEQVLTVWSGLRKTETVSKEAYLAPGKSRIEYVHPKEIAGRLVVNDGKTRWEYNPSERLVVRSPILRHPVRDNALSLTTRRVLRAYKTRVSVPHELSAGRAVYRIDFIPRDRDRAGKTWWVDRQTFVALRRDVIEPDGKLRNSSAYRSINFRARVDPAIARFSAPRGSRVVDGNATETSASSYRAAQAILPGWARVPREIGSGFDFDTLRIVLSRGEKSYQVQYSDGLVGLSVFLSPRTSRPSTESGSGKQVNLGRARGTLMQPFPPYRVLSWTLGGKTYSIVSDISEKTLLAIARKFF